MTHALRRSSSRYRAAAVSAVAPSIVQSATAFIQPATYVMPATLTDPADAGNLLLWVAIIDKQAGTLTMSGSGWTTPVNLRAAAVSMAISYKTAVGGETTLSGTFTSGGNVSGSRVWVCELSSANTGAWTVVSASTNNDATDAVTWPSGTTAAVTQLSRALAIFGTDSISSSGTSATYTNGYTQLYKSAKEGDGGEAGIWVAQNTLAVGATASSTISKVGGSSDEMNGAVVAIGRAA